MSETQNTPSECPSADALSELCDMADSEGGTVRTHVDSCSGCRSVVETYTKIDGVTKKRMEPPHNLEARIKEACRGTSPVRTPVLLTVWSRPVVRVAAALAVTGVLGVLAVMASRDGGKQIAQKESVSPAAAEVIVSAPPASSNALPEKRPVIDSSDVMTVDTSGHAGTGATMPSIQRLAILPPHVKHVWTVDDVGDAEKLFCSLLPENAAPSTEKLSSSRRAISVSLRDEQLQDLVNRLSAGDWDLVTSALPQPRKEAEVHFLGRAVRYDIEMVER